MDKDFHSLEQQVMAILYQNRIIHTSFRLLIYILCRNHHQNFYLVITEQHDIKSRHKELKKKKGQPNLHILLPSLKNGLLTAFVLWARPWETQLLFLTRDLIVLTYLEKNGQEKEKDKSWLHMPLPIAKGQNTTRDWEPFLHA